MKRLTAKKTRINDIINGEYFQKEGFESNYVVTPFGRKVSRVNIIGTVMKKFVTEDGSYGFIVLDDETETIRAKVFKDISPLKDIKEGDLVKVIGKVREYEGEIYLNLEHAKPTKNPNWITLRMLEIKKTEKELREKVESIKTKDLTQEEMFQLAKRKGIDKELLIQTESSEEESKEKEDKKEIKEKILNIIAELDEGKGASYSDIIDKSEIEEKDIENIINDLLTEGTCYEPRPGRIKKL